MKIKFLILVLCFQLGISQSLFLTKGNTKLRVSYNDYIGFVTKNETISYHKKGKLSPRIINFSRDSIKIIIPVRSHDTLIKENEVTAEFNDNSKFINDRKKRLKKEKFIKFLVVDDSSIKSYKIDEIKKIKTRTTVYGCMGCIMPPLLFYYLIKTSPRNYNMNKWNLTVKPKI